MYTYCDALTATIRSLFSATQTTPGNLDPPLSWINSLRQHHSTGTGITTYIHGSDGRTYAIDVRPVRKATGI